MVYLITGKADAGKTHYVQTFAKELTEDGYRVKVIDGDVFRKERRNEDFSDEGRLRNLTDAAKLAREFEKQGFTVLLSFVAPKKKWRNKMRSYWKESQVIYIPGGTLWPGTSYERPKEGKRYWRKIRVNILLIQGIVYRCFIIMCNFLFFFIIMDDPVKALKFSLGWNMINIMLYYGFHYIWLKVFKLGKERE